MRALAALLAVGLIAGPAVAADRYLVATRQAAKSTELRLVRESAEFRSHAVRAFDAVDAFAADLSADEVAMLKRSSDVRYVTPAVERHVLADRHIASNGSAYRAAQFIPQGVIMVHAPELWPFAKGAQIN